MGTPPYPTNEMPEFQRSVEDSRIDLLSSQYESLFVLSVQVRVDGEPMQLECRGLGLTPFLYCPAHKVSISQEKLLKAVSAVCKEFSVHQVIRMKCGPCPLFEVEFAYQKSLLVFMAALGKDHFQNKLETTLNQYLHNGQSIQSLVETNLYLLTPKTTREDPILRQVTANNVQDCISIFAQGKLFDFGVLFRAFHGGEFPHREPKLRTLAMELNEVVHWFSLGVFLGVPSHELERVRLIHSYRRDGLIEMLDLWLKGGDANYRDLITALQFCGLTSLAQKLTVKHGLVLSVDRSPKHSPRLIQNTRLSLTDVYTRDAQLLVKMGEVESQENELARLMVQVEQSESGNQEMGDKLQAIATSLNEAVHKIKLRNNRHKELYHQLDLKKQQRSCLCKQDSNEQAMMELLIEIESTIEDLDKKISEIETEIQQHEKDERELRQNLLEKELEFQEQSSVLQKLREQYRQFQAVLEERSRQFDFQLQQMVAQQQSTTELENQLKAQISYLKKELSSYQCSTLPRTGQASSTSSPQTIHMAAMEKHLEHLEERLQEVMISCEPSPVEKEPSQQYPLFYHKGISNLDAERILTQEKHPVGAFLVWKGPASTCCTPMMSILGKDRVHHSSISQEFIDHYSTPERFVGYFQADPSAVQCCPTVPCLRENLLEDLETPESSLIELVEQVRESRLANFWSGCYGEERKKVLVKVMKRECSSVCQFQSEAVVMKDFRHVNILRIKAVVTGQQPCLITESVLHVSLLSYFKKDKCHTMDASNLVNISAQVACGMAYLESRRCIHRNLAARNVILTKAGAKISNFSQACYTPSGKFICDPGLILLRWTAPEVIWENTFSCKSDVWSFGVLLWEIFTHGELPYTRLRDEAVREKIRAGYRLPQPWRCPQAIYSLMTECWKDLPDKRPIFSTLADNLMKHKYVINAYYTIVF